MAEVLGAVASGFAIAGVVVKGGTAIAKLRRLWAEVKDAPNTIDDLLIQLEILEPMLADFESQFTAEYAPLRAGILNNIGAVRSAKYCRVVMDELKQIVEELSVAIDSSRRRTRSAAKVRVVLRKDMLSRLQEQLERAVRFMNLAHLGYQKAMIESLPDIIIAKQASLGTIESRSVSEDQRSDSLADTDESTDHYQTSGTTLTERSHFSIEARSRHRRPQWKPFDVFGSVKGSILGSVTVVCDGPASTWAARLQFPSWLSSSVIHLQATRAQKGWQINLNPICIRPGDAEIFWAAKLGDSECIKELIDKGQASPFDTNSDGLGIFFWCVHFEEINCALRLLDLGYYPSKREIEVLAQALSNYECLERQGAQLQAILRRSTAYYQTGGLIEFADTFSCSPEHLRDKFDPVAFRNILEECYPSHYELPAFERLDAGTGNLWHREPQMLRFLLRRDGIITRDDLEEVLDEGEGEPFTHLIGYHFGHMFTEKGFLARRDAWQDLLHDALHVFPDLLTFVSERVWGTTWLEDIRGTFHMEELLPVTPLVRLLLSANSRQLSVIHFTRQPVRYLEKPLFYWLQCLIRCGVDLEEYGAVEQHLFLRHTSTYLNNFRWSLGRGATSRQFYSCGPRFKGFRYGPRPEDWSLIWDMECEEFAGCFWKWVEDRPVNMPGAWVDDE